MTIGALSWLVVNIARVHVMKPAFQRDLSRCAKRCNGRLEAHPACANPGGRRKNEAAHPDPAQPHVVLYDRIAARKAVFDPQRLENPGLLVVQLGLVAATTYIGSDTSDFHVFQTLMLVLSLTGLLLGAVTSERRIVTQRLCEQQIELARMSASVQAGAMGMALAHELSQPLSTVAAYLHAARRLLQSGATSERLMDTLNKAEAGAQRTREVMERVREFVSTGKMDLQALDLSALARKIATLCREDAARRGIEVGIAGSHPAAPIRADRLQIEQVLNNLVVNAIDAASERPGARGRVIIRVATRGERVVMQVEDNGPGVAPEIADRMFEPYQTTKPRGMGLGLHLSQQIVQKHAGHLWWEPDVPEGTRFVVELPIDGPDQNAA
jgi:two-component system, LuxR family, sensor kinase FixL